MVVSSAIILTMSGTSVLTSYTESTGQESSVNTVEEIDTQLSSIASVGGLTRVEFSIGDAQPGHVRVVQSGEINVTVNQNASCTATIGLSSIRYEREDGVTFGYEAGGVFRQESDLLEQTAMHTPPDFTFSDGTISMTVLNLSGRVTETTNPVVENVSASIAANDEVRSNLFQSDCRRPDNVTISVQSDYYRAWNRYLRNELDSTSQTSFDSNRTVRVFFDQDKLPESTDDRFNDVVDLTNEEFNDIDVTNNSIKVNKSADNDYTTIVTPLSTGSTQVGEMRVVQADEIFRPPLDVVFVIDDSGSMDGTKIEDARDAAQSFAGQMNADKDRAGAVGFDDDAHFLYNRSSSPNHHVYLTDDFDSVNSSVDTLEAGGGTASARGLRKALAIHGLKSNSSREKYIILLSDGEDSNGAPDPLVEAENADADGITIHSVGFGDPDNATLTDIAETTGGTYHFVDDSSDLTEVFLDLFKEISEQKQIIRTPMSMELTAGGTTYYPQIDGDTSHVATGANGEYNLNDPLAPSQFSYSIDISDGEEVSMTAVDYECDKWVRTDIVHENETTGEQYYEVRCAEIDESTRTEIPASDTSVYIDGDNVSSLLDQPSNWWNDDLQNETLAPYLEADNETLDVESNQALVEFVFEDDDGYTDRMLVLYQIGQSTEDAVPRYIFNIEVRYLEIGD